MFARYAAPRLSRARSWSLCAAAWIAADVFGLVCRLGEEGGKGRGGGHLSGSELSHLRREFAVSSKVGFYSG